MSNTLPCIVCDREIEGINNGPDYTGNQPHGATTFVSHGQYGSTIWDPMDGSYIEINVCDECLAEKHPHINTGRSTRPVVLEYCGNVGWQDIDHESKPWEPGGERPFKSRRNLKVAELDDLPDDIHLRFTDLASLRDLALHNKEQGLRRW